ncbi:MAG: thioredoxin domain-containing protein [bacterium]|nr:thioredoxin domain-containing protein [bacterium]
MANTRFRWGLWGTVAGIVAIGIAGVALSSRGPKVSYDNVNSPRPFEGNASAKVVVQEYSDFQCPACGAVYPFVKSLVGKYAKDIRLEFKHLPLTKIHINAYSAALASECANDLGKFWPYHDKLFENQTSLGTSDLKKYAVDLGLDTTKFNACLDTRAKKSVVDADVSEGTTKQVPGTPTFFVNGQQTATGDLEKAIKSAIGGAVQGPVQ